MTKTHVKMKVVQRIEDDVRRLVWSVVGGAMTHHNGAAQVFVGVDVAGHFVVLAAVLPIAITILARPAMYNGIRHFVFVLPALAVLGGLAGARLAEIRGLLDELWKSSPADQPKIITASQASDTSKSSSTTGRTFGWNAAAGIATDKAGQSGKADKASRSAGKLVWRRHRVQEILQFARVRFL